VFLILAAAFVVLTAAFPPSARNSAMLVVPFVAERE
jgi:hypothetical protein